MASKTSKTAPLSGSSGKRNVAIEAALVKAGSATVAEITVASGRKAVYQHMRWLLARGLVERVDRNTWRVARKGRRRKAA
jgi:hypothetical protein